MRQSLKILDFFCMVTSQREDQRVSLDQAEPQADSFWASPKAHLTTNEPALLQMDALSASRWVLGDLGAQVK